jgi:hypothetical protein
VLQPYARIADEKSREIVDRRPAERTLKHFSIGLTLSVLSSPGSIGRSSKRRPSLLDCPVKASTSAQPGNDTGRISQKGKCSKRKRFLIVPKESFMLSAELGLMIIYRLLALFVAGMMMVVVWRERDWRTQLFAALVFVPFILRAAGVK